MLEALAIKPKEFGVYNPTKEDFTCTYDTNGDGQPLSYTVNSMDIAFFPDFIAEHVKKHLADKIIQARGVKTNHEDEYKDILEEISVKL